jgi:hypothetical protein
VGEETRGFFVLFSFLNRSFFFFCLFVYCLVPMGRRLGELYLVINHDLLVSCEVHLDIGLLISVVKK